jgi:hypothetical protein
VPNRGDHERNKVIGNENRMPEQIEKGESTSPDTPLYIVRSLGKAVFELNTGDFAVVGADVTQTFPLPDDAGCSDLESIVFVQRAMLEGLPDLFGDKASG